MPVGEDSSLGSLNKHFKNLPDPAKVRVWLGPCIGRDAFEVGPEVVDAFVSRNAHWGRYFKSVSDSDRSMADLRGIACDLLENLGVVIFKRFDACTYSDSTRWYSYRRSGVTGRMASCIMRTE